MQKKAVIEVIDLKKEFEHQAVLNGVNLTIFESELFSIIGISGGGKSILLKNIIGLIKPDSGRIKIDGSDITGLNQESLNSIREKFGVLFQGGALFDSLTVYQNIAFPLREKTTMDEKLIREKVHAALDDVGLKGMGKKYPAELSGGMKKRAALARAIITEPSIVFFDEPTTGLDPARKNSIHKLIKKHHEKYGFTGIIVSHEIPEIFEVVDRVAMLHNGVILQVGTPEEIKNSLLQEVKQFVQGDMEL